MIKVICKRCGHIWAGNHLDNCPRCNYHRTAEYRPAVNVRWDFLAVWSALLLFSGMMIGGAIVWLIRAFTLSPCP